jgi:hypothetical protein
LVAVEEGKFNPSIALKDMNFKRQLKIGGSLKALLMEQVEKDTRVRCLCFPPLPLRSS